ncbi:TPA: protein kinase [Escherichia coli]|nr:protein kinase [Escherichia coli]HBA4352467.1 protein kinase [Escherichia coli]
MDKFRTYILTTHEEIGSGGYGVVERITLSNILGYQGKDYARKRLIPDASDPELHERFKREVHCQTKCIHNNIIQIYMCDLDSSVPWFLMELAECSLEDEIAAGTLNQDDKVKIIKMVLSGLGFIHSKNYIHRDIKPLNILKFSSGVYKLSDFGLAKSLSPAKTQFATKIGVFLGTAKYFDHGVIVHGYSPQSDIYSIGVLMEDLDMEGYDDIINKCKHRQLNKRFVNTEQILTAINELEAA